MPYARDLDKIKESGAIRTEGYRVRVSLPCCGKSKEVVNFQCGVNGESTSTFTNMYHLSPLASGDGPSQIIKFCNLFGVTAQPVRRTFSKKVTPPLKDVIAARGAESRKDALVALINDRREKGKSVIGVGFDAAWTSRRDANECAGKFLATEEVPGYPKKPCLAMEFALKPRLRRAEDNETVVATLRDGNFDGKAGQMEHFVLENIINKDSEFMQVLEELRRDGEDAFALEIVIDGDLDSLRTLGSRNIKVYVDYPHQKVNIGKRIDKDDWLKPSRESILRWFDDVMYACKDVFRDEEGVPLRNPKAKLLSREEITEELVSDQLLQWVAHHQGNHDKCWEQICNHSEVVAPVRIVALQFVQNVFVKSWVGIGDEFDVEAMIEGFDGENSE
ncbi:hypothetical protein HDU98_005594 [Podochytrium sp. JEL0797]|nr:hypothetical protein HDU98_005594 [Podochytrium sp. JEL0797]